MEAHQNKKQAPGRSYGADLDLDTDADAAEVRQDIAQLLEVLRKDKVIELHRHKTSDGSVSDGKEDRSVAHKRRQRQGKLRVQ